MSNWHGGKGSRRRNPNEKKYQENWNKIFNNKQNKKEKENESTKHKRVL